MFSNVLLFIWEQKQQTKKYPKNMLGEMGKKWANKIITFIVFLRQGLIVFVLGWKLQHQTLCFNDRLLTRIASCIFIVHTVLFGVLASWKVLMFSDLQIFFHLDWIADAFQTLKAYFPSSQAKNLQFCSVY